MITTKSPTKLNWPLHHMLLKTSQQFAALTITARVRLVAGVCLLFAIFFILLFLYLGSVLLTETSLAHHPLSLNINPHELLKFLTK